MPRADTDNASTREGRLHRWRAWPWPGDRDLALSVEQFVRTIPFVRRRGMIADKAPVRAGFTVDRGPSREVEPAPHRPVRGR